MTAQIHYHFQEIKTVARRTGKCSVCGRRTARSLTFTGTVNPFNKSAAGEVKDRGEVYADVKARADAWAPDQEIFDHAACVAPAPPEPPAPQSRSEDAARYLRRYRDTRAKVERFALAHDLWDVELQISVSSDDTPATITLWGLTEAEFLLWVLALGEEALVVDRYAAYRGLFIEQNDADWHHVIARLELDGLRWCLTTDLHRIHSGAPKLGGAHVDWRHLDSGKRTNYGDITVSEFRRAMAGLGIPEILRAER